MATIMITQEVKNFDEWKKFFDADEERRTSAGIKLTGLYKGSDNENTVIVITDASSVEAAHAFVSNPALKEVMEKAGVISADIKILNKVN